MQLPSNLLTLTATERRRLENKIYEHYYPLVRRLYVKRTSDFAMAEEHAVVVLTKVLTKLEKYNPTYAFDCWVWRIAENYLIDYYRRRATPRQQHHRNMTGWDDMPLGVEPSTSDLTMEYLMGNEIKEVLEKITGVEREIVEKSLTEKSTNRTLGKEFKLPPRLIGEIVRNARQQVLTAIT